MAVLAGVGAWWLAAGAIGGAVLLCGAVAVKVDDGASAEVCADAATSTRRGRRSGKAYERVAKRPFRAIAARRWPGAAIHWQRRIYPPATQVGADYVSTKWVDGDPVVERVRWAAGRMWSSDDGGGYRVADGYVRARGGEEVILELKNVNEYVGWVTGVFGTLRPDIAAWVDGFAGQALGYMAYCHARARRGHRCRVLYGYCSRPHPGHLAVLAGLKARFVRRAISEGVRQFPLEIRGGFATGGWDCTRGEERSRAPSGETGVEYDSLED